MSVGFLILQLLAFSVLGAEIRHEFAPGTFLHPGNKCVSRAPQANVKKKKIYSKRREQTYARVCHAEEW